VVNNKNQRCSLAWSGNKDGKKILHCLSLFFCGQNLPELTIISKYWQFIYNYLSLVKKRKKRQVDKLCVCKPTKEIKNAPSALLSYISTWEFLRTREKCGEARAEGLKKHAQSTV